MSTDVCIPDLQLWRDYISREKIETVYYIVKTDYLLLIP